MATGTPYEVVFESFLAKIQDDDWFDYMEKADYEKDWVAILRSAVSQFKFPRFNTKLNDEEQCFADELTEQEIEILGQLMKQEWLDRTIHSWEQVKLIYDERDFSPANMLAQLIKALEFTSNKIYKLQKNYSRSILNEDGDKKVFDYTVFGGS